MASLSETFGGVMKPLQLLLGLSVSGLLLASCAKNPAPKQAQSASMQSASSGSKVVSQTPDQSADQPVPITNTVKVLPVPGLLPSIAPADRAKIVTGSRSNPSAPQPSTAIPLRSTTGAQAASVKSAKAKSAAKATNWTKLKVTTTKPAQVAVRSPIPSQPQQNQAPSRTPNPQPINLASAVEVSGVVRTKAGMSAIVKAPGEPTSRSVKAGEYLANGSILVKRIEADQGGEPIVVLEQNGVEVMRSVGTALTTRTS